MTASGERGSGEPPDSPDGGEEDGPDGSGQDGPDGGEEDGRARRDRAARRRRLDDIFGDVLPATTKDEREPGERRGFSAQHYRANRPPHHDR